MASLILARWSWAWLGLALSLIAPAPAAFAGQPVNLRGDITSGPDVTLGDLFETSSPAASVVVGYGAPAGQNAVLDAGEVQRLAHMHGLDWDNPNGVRRIIVRSEGARALAVPSERATINALTYARNIGAGEILQPQDLIYGKVAAFSAPQDMPRDADTLIGKMAKRPLRAGAPAAAHDVVAAQVIRRDDTVQVVYRDGGISLTLQGKSMGSATIGEPVAVLNTASKKVIQAIAIGPDQAVVGPDAEQIRAETMISPAAFASLR